MHQIRSRTTWVYGGLLSVFTLTAVTIGIAQSRLPVQPAIFAEVYVDAPLLKLLAGSPPDFEDDLQTHAEFVTRPAVLGAVLKRPEIAKIAIVKLHEPNGLHWLARQVQVEARSPTTLRIFYVGEPLREAAILIDGIAAAYIDEILEVTARLRAERIDELERAQRDVEHRLEEKREAISRLVKLLSTANTPSTSASAVPSDQDPLTIWAGELEILKKAVVEGEEIGARIAADLAKLKNLPRQTGVGMLRMA